MPCSHHLTNLLLVAAPSVQQQTSDPFKGRAMECSERYFVLFMFVYPQKETHSMCSFSLTGGTPLKVMECLKGRSEEEGSQPPSPKCHVHNFTPEQLQWWQCCSRAVSIPHNPQCLSRDTGNLPWEPSRQSSAPSRGTLQLLYWFLTDCSLVCKHLLIQITTMQ